jgi:thiol-disulfide isomerase/thioredoxin
MKAIFIWGICLYLCQAKAEAQAGTPLLSSKAAYLKIGDTLPDLLLENAENFEKQSVRLSDFRGRLLILDFWGINCTSCIAAMPKMQQLQNTFGHKIQILMVTKNTQAQVKKLKDRLPILQKIKLPMVNNDTVLSRWFSFSTVPTHVWIDEKGIVRYITDGWETTYEKIENYLQGEAIHMAFKEDKKDFDPTVPLWLEGGGRQVKHLKYYSFIMGRLTDSRTSTYSVMPDSCNGVIELKATNRSIINLFQQAFDEGDKYDYTFSNPNRVRLEFYGAEAYKYPDDANKYDEWCNKNLFCYELVLPKEKANSLYEVMKQDLERFFGLKGSIEKRKVSCLVLERTGAKDKIRPDKDENYYVNLNAFESNLTIRNAPMTNLKKQLENVYWKRFNILDETNYKGNITLELNVDLANLELLKKALLKYGLKLSEQEREIDMLVIKKI